MNLRINSSFKKILWLLSILVGVMSLISLALIIRNNKLSYEYYKGYTQYFKSAQIKHIYIDKWMPEFEVYARDNKFLPPPPHHKKRVIFFGDSITLRWDLNKYFSDLPIQYVNRGIGSENTNDMLTRYIQDVIQLKPSGLVILAGINDIWRFRISSNTVTTNLSLMCELARCRGIEVFLGTILPTMEGPEDSNEDRPEKRRHIKKDINTWIENYCREGNCHVLNYFDALREEHDKLNPQYAFDAIHLNDDGYRVITPLVKESLTKYLLKNPTK